MGTNYYWRKNICESCKRYEEIHIGKSSFGWTFSFHGTDEIRSYKDWIKKLESEGEIYDEYDEKICLDEFKYLVQARTKAKLNHTIQCEKDYRFSSFNTWLDEDGHSFSSGEFC